MIRYEDFLKDKTVTESPVGLTDVTLKNSQLFDFQRDITKWALRRGRAAIFADCGLGKTLMQLEWARHVPGNVLILAPLAVAQQTVREGVKFDIDVTYHRSQPDTAGIHITNYEMLEHFNPEFYHGIVLDESSILKSFTGKIRNEIIDTFQCVPFRLACTATPAPNDYMELGNHSEFLGVMSRTEMLSMFFVHDGGDTSKWRLKGHAEDDYWKWLCSWAVTIRKPSDLHYEDKDFILPPVVMHEQVIKTNSPLEGELFVREAQTLQDRQKARKQTIEDRVKICADMVNASNETWIIWCNLNSESDGLYKSIEGSVQVKGSDRREFKERALVDFSNQKIRVLISKPSICGFGMNWQHCHNMAFVGLSDSYEQYYQASRRCWRFGQEKPVNIHIITADIEGAVVKNIQRKERDALKMANNMVKHMQVLNEQNIKCARAQSSTYKPSNKIEVPSWL